MNATRYSRSASDKSSPWQNGYIERWFGNFKTELGQLNQSQDLPQFHEAIALQIHYFNHERIHSALGMNEASGLRRYTPNQSC